MTAKLEEITAKVKDEFAKIDEKKKADLELAKENYRISLEAGQKVLKPFELFFEKIGFNSKYVEGGRVLMVNAFYAEDKVEYFFINTFPLDSSIGQVNRCFEVHGLDKVELPDGNVSVYSSQTLLERGGVANMDAYGTIDDILCWFAEVVVHLKKDDGYGQRPACTSREYIELVEKRLEELNKAEFELMGFWGRLALKLWGEKSTEPTKKQKAALSWGV